MIGIDFVFTAAALVGFFVGLYYYNVYSEKVYIDENRATNTKKEVLSNYKG